MTPGRELSLDQLATLRDLRARVVDRLQAEANELAEEMIAEGRAKLLVCMAMVSSAAELLGHAILDNADPKDAEALWAETAELVAMFVRQNAAREAAIGDAPMPARVTLQ